MRWRICHAQAEVIHLDALIRRADGANRYVRHVWNDRAVRPERVDVVGERRGPDSSARLIVPGVACVACVVCRGKRKGKSVSLVRKRQ
jgi:hypothetical protein